MKKTVFIGISGGVDSSVAAYLLKEQGYRVIGVFLHLGHPIPPHLDDVMRKIGIPWIEKELPMPFSSAVIEKTIEMYKDGLTPNPCSLCNRDAKMWGLYLVMKEMKGDFIATGHYSNTTHAYGTYLLKRTSSNPKDQTYFLALIKREIVPHLIFPLSTLTKDKIYGIAENIGILDIIGRKESQDICFAKKMGDFLRHHLGERSGPIILFPEGKKIGTHRGSHLYTVGERLGAHPKTRERLYVIKKEGNTLYVAPRQFLMKKTIKLRDINRFIDPLPDTNLYIQTRYRGPLSAVEEINGNIVKLREGTVATLGQIGAIYDEKEHLLVGGIIEGGENL